jgi:biopolymer transport protein TolQ
MLYDLSIPFELSSFPVAASLMVVFKETTIAGRIVLFALFVGSIFSWSVIFYKLKHLHVAKRQNARFTNLFRQERAPLRIYENKIHFHGSPLFEVYEAGCKELCFQLLGSTEVDETFQDRLKNAPKLSPAQMGTVTAAMERAVGEALLKLESLMIILSTAVSGAPFLGLLGTVWGVMDAFAGMATAGNANLAAMAPGVSGALITTVTGLLVAIPAMFGYNFLVVSIRSLVMQCENFAAELASLIDHRYGAHKTGDK